jgi:hypothetical protein
MGAPGEEGAFAAEAEADGTGGKEGVLADVAGAVGAVGGSERPQAQPFAMSTPSRGRP